MLQKYIYLLKSIFQIKQNRSIVLCSRKYKSNIHSLIHETVNNFFYHLKEGNLHFNSGSFKTGQENNCHSKRHNLSQDTFM